MMLTDNLVSLIRDSCVAAGNLAKTEMPNWGRDKENKFLEIFGHTLLALTLRAELPAGLRKLGGQIQFRAPSFSSWFIDLVFEYGSQRFAIEGKLKTRSDEGTPDNRKAAFFDLFKCEYYVDSGDYESAFFLFVTDEGKYLQQATGDSKDFSIHSGRVYRKNTPLNASRARNATMPLPLTLKRDYIFKWYPIGDNWYILSFRVTRQGSMSLF